MFNIRNIGFGEGERPNVSKGGENMRRKYQKVSELVGKHPQKYDEDLGWYEAMVSGTSTSGFLAVPQSEGYVSVRQLSRKTLKGYKRGLEAIKESPASLSGGPHSEYPFLKNKLTEHGFSPFSP